ALLFLAGMHYYVWARLVRDPQLPAGTARLASSLIATMALVLPATLVLSRTRGAPGPMVWIAFLWMGVVFLLSAFLGLADAGRAGSWGAGAGGGRARWPAPAPWWTAPSTSCESTSRPSPASPRRPAASTSAPATTSTTPASTIGSATCRRSGSGRSPTRGSR